MKNVIYPLAAIFILLTSAKMVVSIQSYKVAEGFSVEFSSKDPSGIFSEIKGDVDFDKSDLENSYMNFEINVASISMGNGMKNKKSMTAEWFDEANHPKITFVSTKLEKADKGYYVRGNLTMKGVKRYRKIPVGIESTKSGLKLKGSFWVDRTYYKVGVSSGAVPNKLKITYSIPLTKK